MDVDVDKAVKSPNHSFSLVDKAENAKDKAPSPLSVSDVARSSVWPKLLLVDPFKSINNSNSSFSSNML